MQRDDRGGAPRSMPPEPPPGSPDAHEAPGALTDEETEARDSEHLRLLGVFHYVFSAIVGSTSLLFGVFIVVGVLALNHPEEFTDSVTGEQVPQWFGVLFVTIGAVTVGLGQLLAVMLVLAGRSLSRRKRYLLCVVVAVVCCLIMPLGTILGVITLLVITRESVRESFYRNEDTSPAPYTQAGDLRGP